MVHNTISTPYVSAIVDASAPGARVIFLNNLFESGSQEKTSLPAKRLLAARQGAKATPDRSEDNAWDKLDLPWAEFGKKRGPLMRYGKGQAVEARPDAAAPGAGAGAK